MRHPPRLVFAGAYGALVAMSILSAALGSILPSILPRFWTASACALLFLVFGVIMLRQGLAMDKHAGVQDELKEVQDEIEMAEHGGVDGLAEAGYGATLKKKQSVPLINVNRVISGSSGHGLGIGASHAARQSSIWTQIRNLSSSSTRVQQLRLITLGLRRRVKLLLHPIFIQSFVMTFLGEWGDRSQISTIALAAAHDVVTVTFGTLMGHFICTLAAVLGGFWLATRISVRQASFLVFAFLTAVDVYIEQ